MKKHPRPNHRGQCVLIQTPSEPTGRASWLDPDALACVVPDGEVPDQLNGVPFSHWLTPPSTPQEWAALAHQSRIDEPEFVVPAGFTRVAAGAVVQEPDGRIWLVAPTNQFAGYNATFPKGTLEGQCAQATALTEVFEESGLHVRLRRHLLDVPRSASYTRYYLAERVGGHPADMCWESQAVMLVPVDQLKDHLNSPHDVALVEAIKLLK